MISSLIAFILVSVPLISLSMALHIAFSLARTNLMTGPTERHKVNSKREKNCLKVQ